VNQPRGMYPPVIEWRSQARSGLGTLVGKVQPDATVVSNHCPGHDGGTDEVWPSLIDGIARECARRMLAASCEPRLDAYVIAFAVGRDGCGRRLVVRNYN
jgi:hypothetical protein